MSHNVNPKIYRIKKTEDWDTRGFYGKDMPQYLEEDLVIRNFIENKLKKAGIENIEIERSKNEIKIIIKSSRPGLVIGRGGKGVETLRNLLQKKLFQKRKNSNSDSLSKLKIEIKEVRNPWTSASLVARWMAEQIEKRTPYRRVLKRSLNKIMSNKEIKGARVQVSGRLNGAEIARTEWLKKGRLPRQTIRADIDYAFDEAYCSYGAIGIKVWIYKGERE